MSKFFAVVLMALMLVSVAVPVLATQSRQIALGNVGHFIEDDYNIFTWYATLPSYSNNYWVGLRYASGFDIMPSAAPAAGEPTALVQSWVGASYGLGSEGKYGTLGLFLYHFAMPLNTSFPNLVSWSDDDVYGDSPDNKWTLMYAYPMEKLSLGFIFVRADDHHTVKDETGTTEESKLSYTTVGAGIRFDIGEKSYTDIAADYNFASQKETSPFSAFGTIESDAKAAWNVRGRMFYEWTETVTLVPFVAFGMHDFSLKADSTDYKDTHFGNKGTNFSVGIAANLKVNEDNLLVFAVTPYSYQKLEPSDQPRGETLEDKTVEMPVLNLALESDIRDWLTFRIGAQKFLEKESTKENTADTKDEHTDAFSTFDYFLGLGFHVGDFDIDAVVNNDLPFRVGYWLTGYNAFSDEGSDVPVFMIDAVYHF